MEDTHKSIGETFLSRLRSCELPEFLLSLTSISMAESSASSEGPRDSPRVRLLVTVVQRLETLVFLQPAEARGVRHLEEGRSELRQPARVNGGHFTHVLLGGQNQLVVHQPKKKTRWWSEQALGSPALEEDKIEG